MPKKKLTLNQQISLTIEKLGPQGEGMGWHGTQLFVDGALPGEVVTVRVIEEKASYARGALIEIKKRSPFRVNPPCPYFGRCGGCQMMHLAYHEQLELKRRVVVEALARFEKLTDLHVQPTQPSPKQTHYRNKIQVPVVPNELDHNKLKIGLYSKGSHDLVEFDHCLVHGEVGENIFESVKTLLLQSSLIAYNSKTKSGQLRHLLIRSTVQTGEGLVIFVVANDHHQEAWVKLAENIIRHCETVKGVLLNYNDSEGNVVIGGRWQLLVGRDYIEESVCGLRFQLSPASFFQINSLQAEQLYHKALEFAAIGSEDVVIDAYCGVGTLSLLAAKKARSVIGIEVIPQAIENAKKNARLNGIDNATFICGKAEEEIAKIEQCDLILLNPPRKGCELSLLNAIGELQPDRIVYVSCDPNSLARDLAILYTQGYRIDQITPFDMFPHTSHVEVVARLSRF